MERLNTATDNINRYEVELEVRGSIPFRFCLLLFLKDISISKQEAKAEFKRILSESEVRIRQAAHKLGNSIDAAKPYYESRIYANQVSFMK